jgi:uncharacterized lipoprotein YddW (UPF0748 family)
MKKIVLLLMLTLGTLPLWAQESKREMRGVWIATVEGIDWPPAGVPDAAGQQAALLTILDNAARANLNTVIFQIRPTADAFYRSEHEPWSHWLTGRQGAEPEYDPLAFLIEAADRRGLAVHVWINPYRVWLNNDNLPEYLRPTIERRYAGFLAVYGTTTYLQPADERSRKHIVRVVADIVSNYDIDAVHVDDYFYPYRIAGQEFPDGDYFRRDPRGFTDREAWRRDNVDRTIRAIGDTIRAVKPWVEFGISPFGVWRNASRDARGSNTRAGQTNYDDLYADILKWQQQKWIDYVSPQLYWQIGFAAADYKVLAEWWNQNACGIPVYIGHALYRVDPGSSAAAWRTFGEIVRQVRLNRMLPGIRGSFLYSAKFLARPEFQQAIAEVYGRRTLWPINPRIEPVEPEPPGSPILVRGTRGTSLGWQPESDNRRFVVYRFPRGTKNPDFDDASRILRVTGESILFLPAGSEAEESYDYYVSALSVTHHESEPVPFFEQGE